MSDNENTQNAGQRGFWQEPAGLRIAMRQSALFVVVAASVVALLTIIAYWAIRAEVLEQRKARVQLALETHVALLEEAGRDAGRAQRVLNQLVESGEVDYAALVDGGGAVLAHTFEPFLPDGLGGSATPGWNEIQFDRWQSSASTRAIEVGVPVSEAVLRTGFDRSTVSAAALSLL